MAVVIDGTSGITTPSMDATTVNATDVNATDVTATNEVSAPQVTAGNDIGQVATFAMNTAPAGWLKANGATVSRTTYAALFAAIGTTFGVGDGSTTFNVPDLRGEFLRGWDDGRGIDSARVFGSAQTDEFKSHSHTIPAHDGGGSGVYTAATTGYTRVNSTHAAGGTETRPRNIALLACIKY